MSLFSGSHIDQDWVDRLNGHWTVILISLMSVCSFIARFTGDAITCTALRDLKVQCPNVRAICLQKEVFNVYSETEPGSSGQTESWHLWFPIILFLQALAFRIPAFVWQLFKQALMINLSDTVNSLATCQVMKPHKKEFMFRDAALVISHTITGKCIMGFLYLLVKFLFCINVLAQFIFLTIVVKDRIGIEIGSVETLFANKSMIPVFPKKVICDFEMRSVQSRYKYSLECYLVINEQLEKCYVFLWYWTMVLLLISCFNLLTWFVVLFFPCVNESRVIAYVKSFRTDFGAALSKTFVSRFLATDGLLLILMISTNSSELVAADLTKHLFQIFYETSTRRHQPLCSQYPAGRSAQTMPLYVSRPPFTYIQPSAPPDESDPAPQNIALESLREAQSLIRSKETMN